MKEKLAALRTFMLEEKHRRTLELAGFLLIVALIAALCVSMNMRANMQRRYDGVRDCMGANMYSNLNLMAQTFDMVGVSTADVQYAILPQMKELFYSAVSMNQVLTEVYSDKYSLLTASDISSIESAFSAYDEAFRTEGSTDLAQSNMQSCVTRVRELLSTRYVGGALKPLR